MEILVMTVSAAIVAAFILRPFLAGRQAGAYDWDGSGQSLERDHRRTEIESDVMRFRAALRAHTLCTRCAIANQEGSRFCGQCGRPLGGVSAEASRTAKADG